LHLVVSGRTDQVAYYSAQMIRFNGDTGSNYSATNLYTFGSGLGSDVNDTTGIGYPMVSGASTLADTFGVITAWIPNYANTSNYKQAICSSTAENNSTTNNFWQLRLTAGLWQSTAAITSVTVVGLTGDDFQQYSTFTLYGVTGA